MRRACCLHRARARAAEGLFLRTAWRPGCIAIPAPSHRLCASPPRTSRPRCRRPRRQQWPPAIQSNNEACLRAGHRARARWCRYSSHGSQGQSPANRPRATQRWKRRWRWRAGWLCPVWPQQSRDWDNTAPRITKHEDLQAGQGCGHIWRAIDTQLPKYAQSHLPLALPEAIFIKGPRPPAALQHLPDRVADSCQQLPNRQAAIVGLQPGGLATFPQEVLVRLEGVRV